MTESAAAPVAQAIAKAAVGETDSASASATPRATCSSSSGPSCARSTTAIIVDTLRMLTAVGDTAAVNTVVRDPAAVSVSIDHDGTTVASSSSPRFSRATAVCVIWVD